MINQPKNKVGNAAFTMIELLLVVIIAGLIVGLAVPRFAASYRGARLRNSVRTIVRIHRYARNTCVLNSQTAALLFDVERGTITLVVLPDEETERHSSEFAQRSLRRDSIFSGARGLQGDEPGDFEDAGGGIVERIERRLEDDVEMVEFNSRIEERDIDGIYWVMYYPNGMCDPYSLRLRGPDGTTYVRIEVDAVSGRIEVEYE